MIKNPPLKKTGKPVFAAVLLAGLGLGTSAQAQTVLVPSTVSAFNAANGYTYNYSVTDATTMELAIVTVPTTPGGNLMNLIAPAGFNITYDAGNGLVSFLEDNDANTTQTFAAGATVTGFSFTSFYTPGTVTFDALDISANDYQGPTTAPVNAVPEPTTTLFVLTGLALAGGIMARRRNAQSVPLVQ